VAVCRPPWMGSLVALGALVALLRGGWCWTIS